MRRVGRFLTAWGLDVLVVAAAAATAVGTVQRDDADRPEGLALGFEIVGITVVLLALCARRWFPFLAAAFVWIGSAGLSFLDHQLISTQAGASVCGLGAAVLFGSLRNGLQARVGLVIVLVGAAVIVYHDPTHTTGSLLFTPVLFAVAWLAGFALGDRAERSEAAEERALRAERERESVARVAVAEERARMARELHDVVAHAMSVMVLQVGAVRHRMPIASEEGEMLRNVEQAGRTALAEMRRLLGVLRQRDDLVELAPSPGLDDLPALAGDVRAAGLDVRLHRLGEPVVLPRSLDLSAYRIVQEGLTNALKHSGGRRADVTVAFAPDQLRVEVRDDGPGGFAQNDGLGHGLIGIGERVKAYGGDMSTFIPTTGGFVLRASLPLESVESGGRMTIRVLVVDDQAMVRAGFRLLLADEPDIEVVAEAGNGLEAVEEAARVSPHVVLMDIRMPELDGLEATRRILAADPASRILVLTTFDLDEYVYRALQAGASGFVLKDDPPEQLIAAVRTVAGGDALLSPSVTRRVIAQFTKVHQQPPPEAIETLTPREMDVFRLITRGLSNAEIGRELFISDTTVKTHVTRLLQKLDLRDRAQAIVLAYRCRLFES